MIGACGVFGFHLEHGLMFRSAAILCFMASGAPALAVVPTFQQLMDPAVFPEAQRGMKVQSARLDSGRFVVTTTGARFSADLQAGQITCEQRIGHLRPVARLRLSAPLTGGSLTHAGPGRAILAFERPAATIRVNGDSLLMLHAHAPLVVEVERLIPVAWEASYGSDHLMLDEWGGFGLYCSEPRLEDGYAPRSTMVARYALPADAVLWMAVCPPKPYDWRRSLRDNVVWHWSNKVGYPSDAELRSWRPSGNIALLQSEVMLWRDWNLDFVPRLGAAEFARVRDTLHRLGMRMMVYTSPYYFLKGTPLEPQSMNSFEGGRDYPPGTPTGENIDLFMAAICRLVHTYRPDALYFDGQYMENPAALYALARRSRALLGERGLLEWHSTRALGEGLCYLPPADAYVDFVLRGEEESRRYADYRYLRFFVSGYNAHNSIGVLSNNMSGSLTPELARAVLRVNARLHTIVDWLDEPAIMRSLREDYRSALTPALRAEVERGLDSRQAQVYAEDGGASRRGP